MTEEQPLRESIVVPGTRPGSAREALKLSGPLIIGQLSTTIMWTVDTMLLGRVGKVELAAAGFGGLVIWTLYTFFVGGVQAVATFVSQAKGAGRPRECSVFTWHGVYLALGGAAVLAICAWQFDALLRLAGLDEAVMAECARYSRARMAGAFFVLSMFSLSSFFRGIGDTRTPMVAVILANALNIVLDALLIFGPGPFPRLTTLGAGIATACANFFGFCLLLIAFLRPAIHRVYRTRTDHPFRLRAMVRLLRVGVPMGAQFFLDMGSFTVFMAIVGRLGTNQLAAGQIAIQLLSFSFMPANAIGKAGTTLVGQYLGAGRARLSEAAGWMVVKINLIYALLVAAAFLAAGRWLFVIFNDDPGVIAAGVGIVAHLALFQILDAVQMGYTGVLQGAGDTRFTLIVFAGSSWIVFVPLAYLLAGPLGWGMPGAWVGGVIHLALVVAILTYRFRSGIWKHLRI